VYLYGSSVFGGGGEGLEGLTVVGGVEEPSISSPFKAEVIALATSSLIKSCWEISFWPGSSPRVSFMVPPFFVILFY
jgi:hypothetical protein